MTGPNTTARRLLGWCMLICMGAMGAACDPNTLNESDPWRLQQQQVFPAEVISKTPKTCQEPTDNERYELIDEIFRQDRGIPIEIAFALIYKESSGRHCEDGYIKFNRNGATTDGGVGYCQITPTLNTEQEVIDHAANNLDARTHLEACAELLDRKWDTANRRGNCLVSDTCVEKELLEEWAWPIAIFGPNAIADPNGKSEYVSKVLKLAETPLDPRVKSVQISNPEDCVEKFKFHQPRPELDGYSTAQMRANGCKLHIADGYKGFMTYSGYDLKLTSGGGPGAFSDFHRSGRAVDIGIDGFSGTEGDVRDYGIPVLCPIQSGCEVVAGWFGDYQAQFVRYRRADGKRGFIGRGGQEVLHIGTVNDGDTCRSEVTRSQQSFTKAFGEVIAYTADPHNNRERGYGFVTDKAGPHAHVTRCVPDFDFYDTAVGCDGSPEPFALIFEDEVFSSESLLQTNLNKEDHRNSHGHVIGFAEEDIGQGEVSSNYIATAKDCCAPRCKDPGEDPCKGKTTGWWCEHELDPDLSTSTTRVQCQNNRTVSRETCSGSCQAIPGDHSQCGDDTPDHLAAPQLVYPPDNHHSSSSSPPPTCEWDAPEGATTCRFVMTRLLAHANDIKGEFEPLAGCENRGTCILQAKLEGGNIESYMPSSAVIQEGRDIHWFVRCAGDAGSGDWSEVRSFRLEPGDPDPPQMMCPDGDGIYCGDANGNDTNNLYTCNGGTYTFTQQCANGCQQNGVGQNDTCSPPPASCPSGGGDYCGDANGNDASNLYTCNNGTYTLAQQCSHGCQQNGAGQNDTCSPPPASCPSGNGNYCGDASGNDVTNLYTCTNGTYTLAQQCGQGCVSAPPGQNDYCVAAPANCPSGNGNYCGDENGNDASNLYMCNNGTYMLAQQCTNGCVSAPPGQNDYCAMTPSTCPGGNGDYCGDANGNDAVNLYTCSNGIYTLAQQCTNGCQQNGSGQNDTCSPPPASCPSGNGNYCGDASGNDTGNLYTCTNGTYTLTQQCSNGCVSAPPGQNDYCAMTPASCPSGNGNYCGDQNGNDATNLYTCNNGSYTLTQQCSYGCQQNGAGQNDTCSPPPASCPSGEGDYCGDENGNDTGNLYTCTNGIYTLTQQCSNGCVSAPAGQNDYCAAAMASCPSGDGDYCGDANGNDAGNLYTCSNGTYTLAQQCNHGCQQNGAGQNDTCSPPPTTCGDGTCDTNEDASNCPADCQAAPECTGGPCCSPQGTYQPSTFPCAPETDERYVCPDGESSGDDVYVEIEDRFCSGSSSSCNGEYHWSDPFHHESCSSNQACQEGQSSCQPIAPICVEECQSDTPAYRSPTQAEVAQPNGGEVIQLTLVDSSDCQNLTLRADKSMGSLGAGTYFLRSGSCKEFGEIREVVTLTQSEPYIDFQTDYRGDVGEDKMFCVTKRDANAPSLVQDAFFYSNLALLEKVEVCQ